MEAPRVTFYVLTGADERAWLVYASRLVEKAYLLEHRVRVHCGSAELAGRLDSVLWTFSDRSFVPHGLAGSAGADGATVVISATDHDAPAADLLVNLGYEVPPDFHRYARVAEVVDADEDRRRAGRERFRFYRDRGIETETHTVGQP